MKKIQPAAQSCQPSCLAGVCRHTFILFTAAFIARCLYEDCGFAKRIWSEYKVKMKVKKIQPADGAKTLTK